MSSIITFSAPNSANLLVKLLPTQPAPPVTNMVLSWLNLFKLIKNNFNCLYVIGYVFIINKIIQYEKNFKGMGTIRRN